jgi:hypothetical protein
VLDFKQPSRCARKDDILRRDDEIARREVEERQLVGPHNAHILGVAEAAAETLHVVEPQLVHAILFGWWQLQAERVLPHIARDDLADDWRRHGVR